MKLETEQILGTLEVLTEGRLLFSTSQNEVSSFTSFLWEEAEKGEFNLLNLGRSQGWLQRTDLDVVVDSWQAVEQTCSVEPDAEPEYLEDEEDYSPVDEATAAQRREKYRSLLQLLEGYLDEIAAYRFGLHPAEYCFAVVIGKTEDGDWICVSPTVARELEIDEDIVARSALPKPAASRPLGEKTKELRSRVEDIASQLEPLTVFGYYGGGYDYRFEYRLVCAAATTRNMALQEALVAARMLETYKFERCEPDWEGLCDDENIEDISRGYDELNQFIERYLPDMIVIRCSFWNWDKVYLVGKPQPGEWVGFCLEI
ncbi:MAG: nuclease A inhibitor family protein [Cyanobacteriota bacterium]|nr:nuclease A inhibitor family protein [Cyanobacteriota bacterium]